MSSMLKRLILIVMLTLVPLQASWAVVGAYCGPVQVGCIDPCYPANPEQQVYSTDVAKQSAATSGMLDHYEHSCHASPAFLISSSHETIPVRISNLAPRFPEATLSLGMLSERPDRPQWLSLA